MVIVQLLFPFSLDADVRSFIVRLFDQRRVQEWEEKNLQVHIYTVCAKESRVSPKEEKKLFYTCEPTNR